MNLQCPVILLRSNWFRGARTVYVVAISS